MQHAIDCFIRGCKAGLIYALVMLLYSYIVTQNITQVHDLDFGFLQNLLPFALVGLGFGGLLGVADAFVNTGSRHIPAWLLACALWAVFVLPTLLLTLVEPSRFEFNVWQHVQGLAFLIFLGLVYSGFKRLEKRNQSSVGA